MSEKPIPVEELSSRVNEREARAAVPEVSLTKTMYVVGREPVPQVKSIERVGSGVRVEGDLFKIDLELPRVAIGVHSFPPGVDGTKLRARRKMLVERDHTEAVTGFLPDHLPLRLRPRKLDRQLVAAKKIDALAAYDPEQRWATTVFAPDDRYTFNDTGFPWCTAGRVETSSGGWASGVMVGPRHLLTCSHAIQWINPPNPFVAGWIKFTPSYFDGSEPFGVAWGIHIYWQQQVVGPGIDATEGRNDYVLVVLDRRMGDLTGWMGSRTYDDGWDGGNYWSHIGYPGDLSSGTRPSFQNGFSLNGDDSEPATNQAMYHTADVWPGQSGGPFFGWWDGEPWPRVVADQSWQNATQNGASGGSNMVDLIIRGRNDWP